MIDKVYSTAKTILIYALLIFLGLFVFTIIKLLFTLVFIVLINFDIVEFDTYNNFKAVMVLLSVILAIYLTPKINNLKSLKAKVTVGALVIILGAIGAVYISMSNYIAKNNTRSLTNSSLNQKNNGTLPIYNCAKISKYGPENSAEEDYWFAYCQ